MLRKRRCSREVSSSLSEKRAVRRRQCVGSGAVKRAPKSDHCEVLNVISGLAWSQPSSRNKQPKNTAVFYADSVSSEEEEEKEEESSREVHKVSSATISPVPLGAGRQSQLPSPHPVREAEQALSFPYPPTMSRYLELLVRRRCGKLKRRLPSSRRKIVLHTLIVDAHIFLARLMRNYLHRRRSQSDGLQTLQKCVLKADEETVKGNTMAS